MAFIPTLFFTFALLLSSSHAVTIVVKNKCSQTIWPATLTGGGPQAKQLSWTGFELAQGDEKTIDVPTPWSGRIWARTQCFPNPTTGLFSCETGDCASPFESCNGATGKPPATLAEFFFAENGGNDFYDISLVDGFNLPASITPNGGTGNCVSPKCSSNINLLCPTDLRAVLNDGTVVGCKSACFAHGRDEDCCLGAFNDPKICKPPTSAMLFEQECPQAYSYAYDDENSTFTCSSTLSYDVTFCP